MNAPFSPPQAGTEMPHVGLTKAQHARQFGGIQVLSMDVIQYRVRYGDGDVRTIERRTKGWVFRDDPLTADGIGRLVPDSGYRIAANGSGLQCVPRGTGSNGSATPRERTLEKRVGRLTRRIERLEALLRELARANAGEPTSDEASR